MKTSHQSVRAKSRRAARVRMADADYLRLADFRYAMRRFLEFSANAARDMGLTSQQHQALLAIKGLTIAGRATIADLATRLVARHHSTVGLVDRLGEVGLVRRGGDGADRRRVIVVLTTRAERILARLSAAHLDELERMRPAFHAMSQLSVSRRVPVKGPRR
jgi:DNA-binding MarR family transcriptional regulator